MNSKRIAKILPVIGLGAILFLVSGCNMPSLDLASDLATSTASNTPTEEVILETEPPTVAPSDTETPEPSVAPTEVIPQGPTMTPLSVPLAPRGSLSEEGPWLLYEGVGELTQSTSLYIVNDDGSGRSPFFVGSFPSLQVEMKPDGDRFAYILPGSESADQVPHLIVRRVPAGEIEVDIPLISEDVWESLAEQEALADQILSALSGVDAFEWSPSLGGHYLAFAAALDNPKLDLYRFDTWTDNIRPLTSGLNHRYQPYWSPGGEWILHLEVEKFGEGGEWDVAAMSMASFDGSESKQLYEVGSRQVLIRWLDETRFLLSRISASGPRDLLRAKTSRSAPQTLYEGPIVNPSEISFDDLQTVAAFCLRDDNGASGVYFYYFDEGVSELVFSGPCRSVEWWQGKGIFIASGDGGIAFIRRTGEVVKRMEDVLDDVALSPDGQWMVAYGEEGAMLFTHIGVLIRQIIEEPVEQVLWNPDGTGMFLEVYARENPFNSHHLYTYALEEWELKLVDLDARGGYFWAILAQVEE
jgi:hypothetical protein